MQSRGDAHAAALEVQLSDLRARIRATEENAREAMQAARAREAELEDHARQLEARISHEQERTMQAPAYRACDAVVVLYLGVVVTLVFVVQS